MSVFLDFLKLIKDIIFNGFGSLFSFISNGVQFFLSIFIEVPSFLFEIFDNLPSFFQVGFVGVFSFIIFVVVFKILTLLFFV